MRPPFPPSFLLLLARQADSRRTRRATFGTADPDAPDFMGVSSTPWMQPRQSSVPEALATSVREPSVSQHDVDARLAAQELDGALVAHLLECASLSLSLSSCAPEGRADELVRRARSVSDVPAVVAAHQRSRPHRAPVRGRRAPTRCSSSTSRGASTFPPPLCAAAELTSPPSEQVLALVTIALSSRLSSHPALFSPGASPIPSCASLTPDVLATQPDLREFGHRRESACEDLRRRAVDLAWRRGTLVETCDESLASCYLLEMLEGCASPSLSLFALEEEGRR